MREKQAAMRLEGALVSLLEGSQLPADGLDPDLRARVRVVEGLLALDLASERRVPDTLPERLAQALAERPARAVAPAQRRPFLLRRAVLATCLGIALALAFLAVVAPHSLAALVEPMVRMIQTVHVGDHTQIVRSAPRTSDDLSASLEQHKARLAKGESWSLFTPYGGFGGSVGKGEPARVRRISSLDKLRSLTPTSLSVPTALYHDEPVRFDHAYVAPGGIVLMFFGSGTTELLLAQFPVGEGQMVSFGRGTSHTTPDGGMVVESPELKVEEMSLGRQAVVWDPDPDPPSPWQPQIFSPATWWPFGQRASSSALRWEADGVSCSLMGRSLTKAEAVDLFLSLRPL